MANRDRLSRGTIFQQDVFFYPWRVIERFKKWFSPFRTRFDTISVWIVTSFELLEKTTNPEKEVSGVWTRITRKNCWIMLIVTESSGPFFRRTIIRRAKRKLKKIYRQREILRTNRRTFFFRTFKRAIHRRRFLHCRVQSSFRLSSRFLQFDRPKNRNESSNKKRRKKICGKTRFFSLDFSSFFSESKVKSRICCSVWRRRSTKRSNGRNSTNKIRFFSFFTKINKEKLFQSKISRRFVFFVFFFFCKWKFFLFVRQIFFFWIFLSKIN